MRMLRVCTVLFALAAGTPAAQVDFDRDIRPILQSRCYECHGEKKQKNGIRFDRKSSVFQGGVSRIRPGRPAELIARNIPSAASMCYDAGGKQLVIPMNPNNGLAFVPID